MKANDVTKVSKALNKYFGSLSQIVNRFKKDWTNKNVTTAIKQHNEYCDKNNLQDDKIKLTNKEIADICRLVARKDFYFLVSFGFAKVDNTICEVVWTEKVSLYDDKDITYNKKYVALPKLTGKVFKPFGFEIDKKTGNFVRKVYDNDIQFINQNDKYKAFKYCFEKTQFTQNEVVRVLQNYIKNGCPDIDGVKFADIKVEKTTKKKATVKEQIAKEQPKKATRKRTTKKQKQTETQAEKPAA